MTTPARKRVLVVGDLMLDRSWIVKARHATSSSQSHGGIAPYTRLYPIAEDFRPGGAGLAATALAVFDDLEVHLLTADCNPLDTPLFEHCGIRRDSSATSGSQSVQWHTMPWTSPSRPITTIKTRYYSIEKSPNQKPFLFSRIDSDPPADTQIDSTLPESLPNEFDFILIMDFAKHAVTESLIQNLQERYSTAGFGMDSKNIKLLECFRRRCHVAGLAHSAVFLNREEAANFFAQQFEEQKEKLTISTTQNHLIKLVANDFWPKQTTLVVKLDTDGAILLAHHQGIYWQGRSTVGDRFPDESSVGAGDFYAAGFVAGYLRSSVDSSDRREKVSGADSLGKRYAKLWLQHCTTEFWASEFFKYNGIVIRELPRPADLASKINHESSLAETSPQWLAVGEELQT